MEQILFNTANRALSWIITILSGSTLWISNTEFWEKVDNGGKLLITLLGVLGGFFLVLSYYWQARKRKAECKKIEKEIKS